MTASGKSDPEPFPWENQEAEIMVLRNRFGFLLALSLLMGILVCFVPAAQAGAVDNTARQEIKSLVNQVLDILKDPRYKGDAHKEERRQKLRSLVNKIFDFNNISRRVLGKYYRRFSKEQFEEFKQLFSKLLEKIYLTKIEHYSGEKVLFEEERMLSPQKVVVPTKIVKNDKEIPVEYRMVRKNGKWIGYDVAIEGVSLVKNYRSQFYEILQNKKPEDLLKIMREKVRKLPDK
ncbi:MAG: ABC transporter substrate-binding protein [Thermodesulfatator sp.]|nr:MAG: ABC transporter substrate-binding protein [Thermodesulfatator sp.]